MFWVSLWTDVKDLEVVVEAGQVYTIKQVADYFAVSYGFIYGRIQDGKVAAIKMGNQYRIKGEEVLRLAEVGLA